MYVCIKSCRSIKINHNAWMDRWMDMGIECTRQTDRQTEDRQNKKREKTNNKIIMIMIKLREITHEQEGEEVMDMMNKMGWMDR